MDDFYTILDVVTDILFVIVLCYILYAGLGAIIDDTQKRKRAKKAQQKQDIPARMHATIEQRVRRIVNEELDAREGKMG